MTLSVLGGGVDTLCVVGGVAGGGVGAAVGGVGGGVGCAAVGGGAPNKL